ncbi:hypothetical protein ACFL55_02310 [Candidatus Latescibacterota bacterium]
MRVYLDGFGRDGEFLTLEIPYVNFVRDRKLAQVHIMMTTQRTGSGGTEHTLTFIGLDEYIAMNDTLVYASQQMDTEETVRLGILNVMTIGLVRYVSRTALASCIVINYEPPEGQEVQSAEEVTDKWNYWVFNINGTGRNNEQSTRKTLRINGSLSADRVTPDWKTNFSFSGNDNIQKIKRSVDDDDETSDEWYSSTTKSRTFNALVVKSITPHWSAGFIGGTSISIFGNTKFSYSIAPAIEYDVFPYAESTRRIFTFLYQVDFTDIDYDEETIYLKTSEQLLQEKLTAWYQVRERWGTIETILSGSHYFHDFDKNQLEFTVTLNLRLMEGLSLDLSGSYSRVRDQLNLPKGELTEEEILLNLLHRETDYQLNTSIGFRYTFGSIYSNVVNPRFNTNRAGHVGGGGDGSR